MSEPAAGRFRQTTFFPSANPSSSPEAEQERSTLHTADRRRSDLTKSQLQRLDFFPTPPDVTKALCQRITTEGSCLEPAAGDGVMAEVLANYFGQVDERDICDHAKRGIPIADFTACREVDAYDWVITNPPFYLWDTFALTALRVAKQGVAMFGRVSALEGHRRYETIWSRHPPTRMMPFVRRVHFAPGRLATSNDSTGAIAFAWFVWDDVKNTQPTQIQHILLPATSIVANGSSSSPAPIVERLPLAAE